MISLFDTNKTILKYLDLGYFARFTVIFLVLYYFNLFFYAITVPKGIFFSSFLADHLNYIEWLKACILNGANLITHGFGFATHIEEQLTIKVYDKPGVDLNYACLGLANFSFWIAFVTAHPGSIQKKMYWSFVGILAISFINCWRIALLLISMEQNWRSVGYIDHHTMFNIASYILIIYLIFLYSKASHKKESSTSDIKLQISS